MTDPLIFDPETGELISSSRGAGMGPETAPRKAAGGSTYTRNGLGSGAYKPPSLEDRYVTALCSGNADEVASTLKLLSGDSSREWSARVITAVIAVMSGNDAELSSLACDTASRIGFHAAIPSLAQTILGKASNQARLAMLRLAASYGAQGTALAESILPLLENSNSEIAEAACSTIGSIGLTPRSVEELASLIRHKEARVRMLCVRMLGLLGARAASVSGLVILRMDDPEAAIRKEAAQSLERMGFNSSAMNEVRRMLNHNNAQRSLEMLHILGRYGSSAQDAASLVIPLLKSDNAELREGAWRTLRIVGIGRDCIRQIEQLARHPSHEVRSAALDLLEECGEAPESCNLAFALMADRDVGLRERAASVVARNGVPSASLPALRKLLRDERDPVRILALEALAQAGQAAQNATKLIIERIEEANIDVAKAAAKTFASVGKVKDNLSDISRLLRNRRQDRKLLTLATLRNMGAEAVDALPLVTACMGDEDWVVRDAACEAFISIGFNDSCMTEVKRLIEHQDRNYRLAVIRALGSCGMSAAAAESFLDQHREDHDAEVGRAAKQALAAVRAK